MPKVTLQGRPGASLRYAHGTKFYVFKHGVPVDVPVAVALELQKREFKGKPVFVVEDLPTIVERAPVQNVNSAPVVQQLRFGPWPLEQQ